LGKRPILNLFGVTRAGHDLAARMEERDDGRGLETYSKGVPGPPCLAIAGMWSVLRRLWRGGRDSRFCLATPSRQRMETLRGRRAPPWELPGLRWARRIRAPARHPAWEWRGRAVRTLPPAERIVEWVEIFPIPSGDDVKSSASLAAKEERSGAESLSPRGIEEV